MLLALLLQRQLRLTLPLLLPLMLCGLTTGCAFIGPRVEVADTRPAVPTALPPPAAVNNGSIFQSASYRPLFEDHRARLVGDTLTVQIVEKVSATQKSTSSVDKSGTLSGSVSALPGVRPAAFARAGADGTSSNTFAGKGTTENSNDFSGTITVVVSGVLPNGHLLIAGEKQIGVNQNVDVLRFSGQVDPRAIQAGNSIFSAAIANVRLEQRGRGAQAEAQAVGWLSRIFLSVMPI
ncbi:MAG: flagellar basal body L-ring protein FlgH [Rubrivivax sp.]|nr:flagellar basal body L-ring protein FlgH [Rubrivivax sp.]